MNNKLLLVLANTLTCFSLHATVITHPYCPKPQPITMHDIHELLHKEAGTLHKAVINKVLTILNCVNQYNVEHNNILTVIDYSLAANEKRLWIFDLEQRKLLFHTYVSHGIKSGALLSTVFSNKYDSKTSSIGLYKTQKTYYGRDGLSLRLDGLDSGFNSNASNRSIVIHGGWYVDEKFIKKYGRAGRSWGCPALPLNLAEPIINTIKNNSLLIVYYPSDDWFLKSKFLKCGKLAPQHNITSLEAAIQPVMDDSKNRDDVLLTTIHSNSSKEENTAVVVMSADSYKRIFQTKAPLDRMLRRQIDTKEYIALSTTELQNVNALNEIYFARPVITMIRGNYVTQMHIINLGKIYDIRLNGGSGYTVYLEENPSSHLKTSISLKSTDRFIRWLGL